MTDEQIIKALECCKIGECDDCPFYGVKEDCEVELPEEALNLINRQKAEIERLQKENERWQNDQSRKAFERRRQQMIKKLRYRFFCIKWLWKNRDWKDTRQKFKAMNREFKKKTKGRAFK